MKGINKALQIKDTMYTAAENSFLSFHFFIFSQLHACAMTHFRSV